MNNPISIAGNISQGRFNFQKLVFMLVTTYLICVIGGIYVIEYISRTEIYDNCLFYRYFWFYKVIPNHV